ncbi:hypothetical protein K443DRAFT_659548 [Laccaria amethystina LaAM-08-1]|uniref:Uncharacterized protein n=1 Tax=Laccaria amethystina LaAM-08-1 TaxID=1095629 RepID=A0A0C9WRN3_9AGAR|nr:hypothetical protein K443DRAFT_659548 [Laccaria amethystina LaAM-08-1]
MQSRPILVKFSTIPRSTLLRRLWTANFLDPRFSLTFLSVVFSYTGPSSSSKRILDTIDLEYPTWSSRKPDSSVHLRLPGTYLPAAQGPGRCAAPLVCTTRPRGLDLSMATIYDKALRKDGQIH